VVVKDGLFLGQTLERFSLLLYHTSFILMSGISNPKLDDYVRLDNPTLD
jgi:hypothetical protein